MNDIPDSVQVESADYDDAYRPNVALVLMNRRRRVLLARRIKRKGWQLPQGGVKSGETLEQAALRELHEEVGVAPQHVRVLGRTRGWRKYDVPQYMQRRDFYGQKQIWFLFEFLGEDTDIRLDHTATPEFDRWCWVSYWSPLHKVVGFKSGVYKEALLELSQLPELAGAIPAQQL